MIGESTDGDHGIPEGCTAWALGVASSGMQFKLTVNAAASDSVAQADKYESLIVAGGNKDEFGKLTGSAPPGALPSSVMDMKQDLENKVAAELAYQNSSLSKVASGCIVVLLSDVDKATAKLALVNGGLGAQGELWKQDLEQKLAEETGTIDFSTPALKDALADFSKKCYANAIKKRTATLVEVRSKRNPPPQVA
jgi:hypothetical protein